MKKYFCPHLRLLYVHIYKFVVLWKSHSMILSLTQQNVLPLLVCNSLSSDNVFASSLANIPLTPETARDQERRIRREIANSNERRRMQSINAGFQSLKTLIPHSDGEKLSKVSQFFLNNNKYTAIKLCK